MNHSESPSPHIPSEDRVVDAALHELARTGSAREDSALVKSILVATVERSPGNVTELPKSSQAIRPWLVGAGAVAALVVLVVTALQSLPYGNSARSHSEVQFVVTITPAPSDSAVLNPTSPPPAMAAVPYEGEVEMVISSTVGKRQTGDLLDQGTEGEWTYPLPLPVSSTIAESATPKKETLEIDSDRVREESDHLVYSGNVELRYRSFLISADKIRLRTESEAGSSAFLTAENASFSAEEEKAFPVTAAIAGELEIDPVSGIIRLRNIDRLETLENGRITIVDTQEVSITAAGYAIETKR